MHRLYQFQFQQSCFTKHAEVVASIVMTMIAIEEEVSIAVSYYYRKRKKSYNTAIIGNGNKQGKQQYEKMKKSHYGIIPAIGSRKSIKHAVLSTLLIAGIISSPIEVKLDFDFTSSSMSSTTTKTAPHHQQALQHQHQHQANFVQVQPSIAYALTEQQVLVSDVWKEVTRQYIDTTYNGLGEEGWKEKRLQAVTKVKDVGPDDNEEVYTTIRNMLTYLDDPYTRFLSPVQYQSIVSVATGGSVGIGVQLAVDPISDYVVVGNVAEDGPAQKSGILPGDIIVRVDGFDMKSTTAEFVAAKMRGEALTYVNIFLRHGSPTGPVKEITSLTIQRKQLKLNQVRASSFMSEGGDGKKQKIGVLVLTSFNQETVAQVLESIQNKSFKDCTKIVIDLRGNLGGYMPAGVDVAKMFLKPQSKVITEVDKNGKANVYINDVPMGSIVDLPMYVLVDENTASASEILTAALQDNGRATVISAGSAKTFGKGRIQNIQIVGGDGCAVSVTKAKYITPKGNDIHKIGITPDTIIPIQNCERADSASKCLADIV